MPKPKISDGINKIPVERSASKNKDNVEKKDVIVQPPASVLINRKKLEHLQLFTYLRILNILDQMLLCDYVTRVFVIIYGF